MGREVRSALPSPSSRGATPISLYHGEPAAPGVAARLGPIAATAKTSLNVWLPESGEGGRYYLEPERMDEMELKSLARFADPEAARDLVAAQWAEIMRMSS